MVSWEGNTIEIHESILSVIASLCRHAHRSYGLLRLHVRVAVRLHRHDLSVFHHGEGGAPDFTLSESGGGNQ